MKQVCTYLVSLGTIALVVSGILGLSFHAFKDRGWIETTLGRLWGLEMEHPLVAIPVTLGALALLWAWRRSHLATGSVSRVPSMIVYALMGAGAYFIGQLALHGAL